MRNVELARSFLDIAAYLEMEDVPFKPRAYEKAAHAIESHDRPLEDVYREGGAKALCGIPGIGKSMAEKLEEMLTGGRCALRESYYRRMPVDLAGLTAICGFGSLGAANNPTLAGLGYACAIGLFWSLAATIFFTLPAAAAAEPKAWREESLQPRVQQPQNV